MYIVHCHYPPRQVKRLINQLLAGGVLRISKTNYTKGYTSQDKKALVTKEVLLHIYADDAKKPYIDSFLEKNMKDCFTVFIPHQ